MSWSSSGPVADCGNIDCIRAAIWFCATSVASAAAIRAASSSGSTPGGGHGDGASHMRNDGPRCLRRGARRGQSSRSAGSPTPSNSTSHLLLVDLGMAAVPVLDAQPVGQCPHDRAVEHLLADGVHVRLGERGVQQDLETLAPAVTAEVMQPGLGTARPTSSSVLAAVTLASRRPYLSTLSGGIDRSIIPLADSPSHV